MAAVRPREVVSAGAEAVAEVVVPLCGVRVRGNLGFSQRDRLSADSLPELPTWHRIDELVKKVTIVTAARPGFVKPAVSDLSEAVGDEAAQVLLSNCCPTPEIDISATRIRARVAAGDPIRYLTPESVASYIQRLGLYGPG